MVEVVVGHGTFSGRAVAKSRFAGECVELAPAIECRGSPKAGASSTHSPAKRDFARFGCDGPSLRSSRLCGFSISKGLRIRQFLLWTYRLAGAGSRAFPPHAAWRPHSRFSSALAGSK